MAHRLEGVWFAPHMKPICRGVYPVRLPTSAHIWKCYWRGDAWGAVSDDATQAETALALVVSAVQDKTWFGFAEWRQYD